MSIAEILAFISSLSAAGALAFLGVQIWDSRRLTKAQFISSLENDLVAHYEVYQKILPGAIWSEKGGGPESADEVFDLVPYLGFFAKIKFLLDLGALDLSLVDRMFVFRFFLAVNNTNAQRHILYSEVYHTYWCEVFALHSQWAGYRREKGLHIPFEESDLKKYNPERYQEMLRAFERRTR